MQYLKTGALILALSLSACASQDQATPDISAPATTSSSSPIPVEPSIWPLTGIAAQESHSLDPVILVKVENDPVVRPQTGLDSADIVVEELVEGGMTRFAAIYQSNIPQVVGPVRSVRHVDAAIAAPIADAFVFSGGAKRTMNFLYRKIPATTTIVTEGGSGMYRDSNHVAPHNVYLKLPELISSLAPNNTPTKGLIELRDDLSLTPSATLPSSSPEPQLDTQLTTNTAISKAKLKFSTNSQPTWHWDAASNSWLRFERSTPFVTPEGKQISTTNVLVLFVETMDAGYTDPAGNYVPRSVLTSGGSGFLLNAGVAAPIKWSKEKVASPISLYDTAGLDLALPVGTTWIELLPRIEGEINFE